MKYKVVCKQYQNDYERELNLAAEDGWVILNCGIKGTTSGYFWAVMERGGAE